MSGIEPPFSAAAVAAAATERALERLVRGATWQAITCEIAWHAVVETGADRGLVKDLARFADASLSELTDGIECRVDAAAVRAGRAHLDRRPHDRAGAELAATIEAGDEAERLVVAAYEETRRQTEAAASTRTQAASVREPRRGRLLPRGSAGASIRPIDLGDLGRRRARYGWPRRNAA